MAMKHHKMYGEWINLSENPPIGKRDGTKLVQAVITYIMENTGAKAIAMGRK